MKDSFHVNVLDVKRELKPQRFYNAKLLEQVQGTDALINLYACKCGFIIGIDYEYLLNADKIIVKCHSCKMYIVMRNV